MNKLGEVKKIMLIVLIFAALFIVLAGKSIYLAFSGEIEISSTFTILGLVGHYYGLIIFLAILAGYLVARKLAALEKINLDKYLVNIFVGFLIALIFARLGYIIFQLDRIESFWEIFATWRGGLSIHGALFGIVMYLFYLSRRYKISFAQFADFLAPGMILGQAIGRWGNFINQEAYGPSTNLVWKMFVSPARRFADFANESFYHPAFLYQSLGNLLIFFILLYIYALDKKAGTVATFYVFLYSILRFIIEFWRVDRVMWGPFSVAQWASIVLVVAALYLFYRRGYQKKSY